MAPHTRRLESSNISLQAQNDFQIKQMQDILHTKLTKRGLDLRCLDYGKIEASLNAAKQVGTLKQGIDKADAKKLTKMIKDSKLKVQTAIQGEQLRVTGKKRDDLQAVIALLKKDPLDLPLQFVNFRD